MPVVVAVMALLVTYLAAAELEKGPFFGPLSLSPRVEGAQVSAAAAGG